ncbi:MAG: hypothetical protein LUD07_07865 [Clostridiales bacterium]|nr:hypothetical protein [Clostridiales bacterium]
MWSKEKVWIVRVDQYHDDHYDDFDPDSEDVNEYLGSEEFSYRSYEEAGKAVERFRKEGEQAMLLSEPEFREIWMEAEPELSQSPQAEKTDRNRKRRGR